MKLQAPFPWFGGKSRIAPEVWRRFGRVCCYVDPFFGSGAVLLGRPRGLLGGCEVVNDKDCFVANFWRAVRWAPDEVARHADWPVSEADLHARGWALLERRDEIALRVDDDPRWHDAEAAGWWAWCQSQFIAGAWRKRNVAKLASFAGVVKPADLPRWMAALSERLQRVQVLCHDWRRLCGGKTGDRLEWVFSLSDEVAFFLDPPYSAEAGRAEGCYRDDDLSVAHAVREWALRWGSDPRLRIALCGYEGEHEMPADWECLAWKAQGGWSNKSQRGGPNDNRGRERVWFSPHCLKSSSPRGFF